MHIVDFSPGHEPYTRLPLFCRIRITPGNHRKHRPEAHRCNRPGDYLDACLSGPDCTRTRPPGASVNRRCGHHGRRPTAGLSGFYRCPAPGPEQGCVSGHGLYGHQAPFWRSTSYSGSSSSATAPVQRPVWHGSAPLPDDGIFLTGGITADGLQFPVTTWARSPLRHNCVQWVLKVSYCDMVAPATGQFRTLCFDNLKALLISSRSLT